MLPSLVLCVLATVPTQSYRQRFPLPDLSVPSGWGVNIHFNDPRPGEMEKLAVAGFRWIRQDLGWNNVEREKGVYDFAPLDRLFAACEKQGIRPLIILDYGNDLYQQGSPRSPESRAAFCQMVAALVRRFQGRGALWEMWNEPNIFFWQPKANVGEYIQLASQVGQTIRRVAPEEYYIGPATSSFDWPFLERCFQAGLLRYWDAVSVHPYRQSEPESVIRDWGRLRGLIDRYAPARRKIPMVSGEWGYSELYGGMDQPRQGYYIARQYLTNLLAGVGLSIWYDWKDDGVDPKETEHHFGSVRPDLTPKAGYQSAKALSASLRGYTFHMRLAQKSPRDFLLVFRRGSEVKYVGWTSERNGARVVLPDGKMLTVAEMPRVLTAVEGPAKSLLLSWRAVPTFLSVGSFPEAESASRTLRARVPNGVAVTFPDVRDDPSTPERVVRTSIRRGPVALEQETILLQPKPVRMSLLAVGGGLRVMIENPGGRTIRGKLVLLQSGSRVVLPVQVASKEAFKVVEMRARLESTAVSVLLEGPGQQIISALKGVRVTPVPLGSEEVSVADDGDPKIKGSYVATFGEEARVRYDWPIGWKFFTLQPKAGAARALPGTPQSLNMMVWGDGQGNVLRMRFTDATGQTFQPDYGPVSWRGWRAVSFRLDDPNVGRWGGASDGIIHYPIRLEAIALLDSPGGIGGKGEVAIRDVTVVSR